MIQYFKLETFIEKGRKNEENTLCFYIINNNLYAFI